MKLQFAIIAATITLGSFAGAATAADAGAATSQKEHHVKLCPMPRAPKSIGPAQWRSCRKAHPYSQQSKRRAPETAQLAADQ
jgi:hypothetical protein